MTQIKTVPLDATHRALGAKMVPFAGFAMPVRYSSDKAEHMAVRSGCGLFDVSHMGEVFIEGPRAIDVVQRLISNDAASLAIGQALYTGMLNAGGTFIDDLIVYRVEETRYLMCTNAGNRSKDTAHIVSVGKAVDDRLGSTTKIVDEGDDWIQLALQGPTAHLVVGELFGEEAAEVKGFHFVRSRWQGHEILVARTGYTGEDGFELYGPNVAGEPLWNAILQQTATPVTPCGLGARDTLRLEAGLCLYGNDIDDTTNPYEAGLAFTVKLDENENFIGRDALIAVKEVGVTRRLRGLVVKERKIPRHGYTVVDAAGAKIGEVTSGTLPPFIEKPVAMAYINKGSTKAGTEVFVDIRGKHVPAEVTKLPFYRRPKPEKKEEL